MYKYVKMYPNPNNGNVLFFELSKNAEITIFNILGKKIKSVNLTSAKKSVDISHLTKGVYLVKIDSAKESITKKLIKN